MSHKSWTFTTYKDGKPVASEKNVDHAGALTRLRAAIAGDEQILADLMAESKIEHPGPELLRDLFLTRAA